MFPSSFPLRCRQKNKGYRGNGTAEVQRAHAADYRACPPVLPKTVCHAGSTARTGRKKDGKPYYDNDLVVAKPDGSPISASWVSSQFGKLLEDLDMPHIRFHDLRHTAATNMHQLTGDFYTVGEVLGHTLAGIGVSLGLSMNFEAVTARYVDVRLERKKEVLDAYHGAVKQADPAKGKGSRAEESKECGEEKKSSEIEL
ncbi:MAG: tyrosine-type recombinase/integrase [Anaerotruncus sp.]|nr:MAG: tyrosine-type recombinase/integrase [Anaerotruncus sp.]